MPSDMQFHIDQIKEYNNLIVTATKDTQLGSNGACKQHQTSISIITFLPGAAPGTPCATATTSTCVTAIPV